MRSRFPLSLLTALALICPLALGSAASARPVDPDSGITVPAPRTQWHPIVPNASAAMLRPYSGLGAWADVYDWSRRYGGARLGLADVDAMAARGVQTLFIQTTKYKVPGAVLEPQRLRGLIKRAHARKMTVVGWYLPTFLDEKRDFAKLQSMVALGVDGITVDVESTDNKNVANRNAKLIRLLQKLDAAVAKSRKPIAIGAAVYPPYILDRSVRMWPNFPWEQMSPHVDVWLPMSYWSCFLRSPSGMGNAAKLTTHTMMKMQAHLGPAARIHVIGGSGMNPLQVARMINRMRGTTNPAIGGSLYDWRTTSATSKKVMQPISQLRIPATSKVASVASSQNATAALLPGGAARIQWWSPDGSVSTTLDAGGALIGQPALALDPAAPASLMLAGRFVQVPSSDDRRTQVPAYLRISATTPTGVWREIPKAPARCQPAVAGLPDHRFLAVCALPDGTAQLAYMSNPSGTWTRWYPLAGVTGIPVDATVTAAAAGTRAAIAWIGTDSKVRVATWIPGKTKPKVSVVTAGGGAAFASSSTMARLNAVSATAMTVTARARTGVYRIPITANPAVAISTPAAPSMSNSRLDVPPSVEFGSDGYSFADGTRISAVRR